MKPTTPCPNCARIAAVVVDARLVCTFCGSEYAVSVPLHPPRVDGKLVTKVQRVVWQHDDDTSILNSAEVIGRSIVDLDGGGRSFGLVVVCAAERFLAASPYNTTTRRPRHHTVIWERTTGRFVAIPMEPSS